MKKIAVFSMASMVSFTILAQSAIPGKVVTNITVTDASGNNQSLPYFGQKATVVLYLDPDVHEIMTPLTDAIKARKFPAAKLSDIVLINTRETWVPTAAIKSAIRKSEREPSEFKTLLDGNRLLATAWDLGDCSSTCVAVVVGADSRIKYIKTVKTKNESNAIVSSLMKAIEEEIAK